MHKTEYEMGDIIKMGLQSVGSEDVAWIHLLLVSDRYRVILNTAMNIQVK